MHIICSISNNSICKSRISNFHTSIQLDSMTRPIFLDGNAHSTDVSFRWRFVEKVPPKKKQITCLTMPVYRIKLVFINLKIIIELYFSASYAFEEKFIIGFTGKYFQSRCRKIQQRANVSFALTTRESTENSSNWKLTIVGNMHVESL